MIIFKAASSLVFLFLALAPTAVRAQFDPHPVRVDLVESCNKGLVVWMPLPPIPKCGYVQMPQVKVFDGMGQLRFMGSALDAIKWAKSGQPSTPIPAGVVVRDVATEARILHIKTPSPGLEWVAFYITNECPPCLTQLETFRSDVLPKLSHGTGMGVFQVTAAGD